MAKFCSDCGAALTGSGRFCAECGAAMNAAGVAPAGNRLGSGDEEDESRLADLSASDTPLTSPRPAGQSPALTDERPEADVLSALAMLASHPDWQARYVVTGSPWLPAGLARQLASDSNGDVRCGVAGNASVPVDVLRHLATDPVSDVRQTVAGNASVPVDVLRQLATDPEELVRCGVAGNASVPVDVLRQLATDPDEDVRNGVAGNASVPVDVLRQLATDPDEDVRNGVAGNASVPVDVLGQLATDPDKSVRARVAGNPSTPADILSQLAAGKHLRRNVAKNPSTRVDLLRQLATQGIGIRMSVAENPSTPADILSQLATDPEMVVRRGVAVNASVPVDVLRQLATDPVSDVRETVAGNASVPVDVLLHLATDLDEGTLRAGVFEVFSRPDANGSELLQIAAEFGEDLTKNRERAAREIISEYNKRREGPYDDGRTYTFHDVAFLRRVSAIDDVVTLQVLAREGPEVLRLAVARNPNTPAYVVMTLSRDVAANLIFRFNEGVEGRDEVLAMIGGTDFADGAVLQVLAQEGPEGLRRAIARNPDTPEDVVMTLSRDVAANLISRFDEGYEGRDEVLAIIRRMDSAQAGVLQSLAHDGSAGLRRAVARNPSTPVDVLTTLTEDAESTVRFFALQTLRRGG